MKNALFLAALLLALTGTQATHAQTPGTGGPDPTAVPLDGGASLLAGGVAYGLRRLHQRRKAA